MNCYFILRPQFGQIRLLAPIALPFIAIFKNSANQNGIFAICSLRMLLVH